MSFFTNQFIIMSVPELKPFCKCPAARNAQIPKEGGSKWFLGIQPNITPILKLVMKTFYSIQQIKRTIFLKNLNLLTILIHWIEKKVRMTSFDMGVIFGWIPKKVYWFSVPIGIVIKNICIIFKLKSRVFFTG